MKIHEYQAKEIFSKYGIPVERHTLCRTAAGVIAAYRRMGTDRVVIKAQVLTGGRGKAGGVVSTGKATREMLIGEAKAYSRHEH